MGGSGSKPTESDVGAGVSSKKFLNDNGARCVEEMLEGMAALHPGQLRRVAGLNVLVRADLEEIKANQVVLVSGGGSGHEPAHAGFCGEGMLTAAVCGGVFASPSVESILSTIRTVTGPKGCLCIVKNYSGDRLNFGLAAEQAKSEGFKVEIVFVGDDAALSDKGVTGRRGLAGAVLVHKVAGAAAASGADLAAVKEAAEAVAESVRTVGVALSVCNVPGKKLSERLVATDGKMELGLGIHGEPGRETLPLMATNELVKTLADIILADFEALDGARPERVVALVNNLGGTTPLEVYGICNSVVSTLAAAPYNLAVERVYAGPVMTSLEMQGVSLSLLAVGHGDSKKEMDAATLLELLDAEASAIGWPGAFATFRGGQALTEVPAAAPPSKEAVDVEAFPQISAEAAAQLEKRMRAAAQALIDNEPKITEWDKLAGDGDAGETFEKGARLVLEALDAGTVQLTSPHLVMAALSEQARKMGGTSGAVLAIFFRACEAQLMAKADYETALKEGCAAITRYGRATPGMRTMLDSLDAMASNYTPDLTALAAEAMKGAEATATMKASAGRSNYVPDEKLRGVPDPGAMAVAYAMQALAEN